MKFVNPILYIILLYYIIKLHCFPVYNITKEVAITEDVEILPEIPAISAEAKRLKNQGINILIALGHSGFETDILIAEAVEDIDLVVGGHSNTFLYTGEYISLL